MPGAPPARRAPRQTHRCRPPRTSRSGRRPAGVSGAEHPLTRSGMFGPASRGVADSTSPPPARRAPRQAKYRRPPRTSRSGRRPAGVPGAEHPLTGSGMFGPASRGVADSTSVGRPLAGSSDATSGNPNAITTATEATRATWWPPVGSQGARDCDAAGLRGCGAAQGGVASGMQPVNSSWISDRPKKSPG